MQVEVMHPWLGYVCYLSSNELDLMDDLFSI